MHDSELCDHRAQRDVDSDGSCDCDIDDCECTSESAVAATMLCVGCVLVVAAMLYMYRH